MVQLFKFTAQLEGLSFLALLANMLVLKPFYFTLYKSVLFPLGMAHGFLFIGYVALAIYIKKSQEWNFKTLLIVLLSSLLPFATFFVEKKFLKNV